MNAKTKAVARIQPGAPVSVESLAGMDRNQIELLKRTVCKGATDDEFLLFAHVCKKTGLDPFSRQIHAVKRWSKKEGREVMSIQLGIDGYRLQAERSGKYAGSDEARYDEGLTEFEMVKAKRPRPQTATITVHKLMGSTRVPFTATALWGEYVAKGKDGKEQGLWPTKPFLMLSKCAEALALRKAFPAELSGLYLKEEMDRADTEDIVITDTPPAPEIIREGIKADQKARIESEGTGKPNLVGQAQLSEIALWMKDFGLSKVQMLELCKTHLKRELKSAVELTLKDYATLKINFDAMKSDQKILLANPMRFENAPSTDSQTGAGKAASPDKGGELPF